MNQYVKLAKQAAEKYFQESSVLQPSNKLPAEILKKKAGVFVTIYKNGKLQGCIGTFLPTKKNIAEEIIANAISAATADYRFEPLTKNELPQLSYEVSILSKPEAIKSLEQLDPQKYGVIVESGFRRGLLLPNLEGINSPEQQVSIAAEKGGIDLNNDTIQLHRFTTTRYK